MTALSKDLAFNLGGHTNHSIFWKNLSPNGGGEPTGDLAEAIERDFGSFEKFKAHFNAAALGLQGSGWAVLAYDKIGQRLVIEQMTDQQGNLSIDLVPLLLLDMWEHAFYLQYKNVKADYVDGCVERLQLGRRRRALRRCQVTRPLCGNTAAPGLASSSASPRAKIFGSDLVPPRGPIFDITPDVELAALV